MIEELLEKRILVLDGAMGTMLQAMGGTNDENVEAVHKAYIESGADIICTNTFVANEGNDIYDTNIRFCRLARKAADGCRDRKIFVAGSVGPSNKTLVMSEDCDFDALQQGRFVVEIDRLSFKRGKTASVSTNTNFISRDRSVAVVQVTFNGVRPGPSGIGGITLRGTVSDVHLEEGRKGIVYYSMRVLGGGIAAEIRITLTSGSNRVRVEVDPDFNSNDITMDGRIVPYDDSSVYRGRVY